MRLHKNLAAIAVIVLISILVGCLHGYGRLAIDPAVGRDFQDGVIRPDLQYYYAGRDNLPYAIIGIDRAYTVASRYWIPIDPQSDRLRKMSGNIYQAHRTMPFGAIISAPDGEHIGIWYSNRVNYTIRVDSQSRTIQVLFTNPENTDSPGRW